jgi:hypothetical protein
VTENAADSLAAANGATRSLRGGRFDQLVREPLVVPLVMVVLGEGMKRRSQVPVSERNGAVQALLFHGADEPPSARSS